MCTDCRVTIDLIFVLDSSSSIGPTKYSRVTSFVKNFAERLNATRGNRIGVITFSNQAEVTFNLTRPANIIDGNIPYRPGETNTPDALCKLGSMFEGARNNALHIGVLLTDGRSTLSDNQCNYTSVSSAATAMKRRYEESLVYVVGVTSNIDRVELDEIATRHEFVNYLESFNVSSLDFARQGISYAICFSGE